MKMDFYEKPGCQGNKKQKIMLQKAGVELMVLDLLNTPWTPESLRPFFGEKPVASWFNPSAPAVKKGELDPAKLTEKKALELMCSDPILIKRPLMHLEGKRMSGFDEKEILAVFGIDLNGKARHLDSCQNTTGEGCSAPLPFAREPRVCDGKVARPAR